MYALEYLRGLPSQELVNLLPATLDAALDDNYVWPHDGIQRSLDHIVARKHDELNDLTRIPGQQDKATLLSTDMSIFRSADTKKRRAGDSQRASYLFG